MICKDGQRCYHVPWPFGPEGLSRRPDRKRWTTARESVIECAPRLVAAGPAMRTARSRPWDRRGDALGVGVQPRGLNLATKALRLCGGLAQRPSHDVSYPWRRRCLRKHRGPFMDSARSRPWTRRGAGHGVLVKPPLWPLRNCPYLSAGPPLGSARARLIWGRCGTGDRTGTPENRAAATQEKQQSNPFPAPPPGTLGGAAVQRLRPLRGGVRRGDLRRPRGARGEHARKGWRPFATARPRAWRSLASLVLVVRVF